MKYQIGVGSGDSPSKALLALQDFVNEKLEEGWVPTGGASISTVGDIRLSGQSMMFIAIQPMTKSDLTGQ